MGSTEENFESSWHRWISESRWLEFCVGSMRFGDPIIAMPLYIDQPLNAGFVVEVGAGLEIKGDKNGMLQRQEVPKVIKDAVEEKTGQHLRRKAG
ncbi:hypothetical protein NC653_026363 [Populus alba x Populus x berolinensis]|uniref:Uncharacterized protein n=1 Tax=Populus alba x Populus x berolinensis TaxID=444605 RepID=A0AAD6MFV3_9ROSI|nr:hypothetical protein NC653_026363 [Populus alba x Populus x berolinensis]